MSQIKNVIFDFGNVIVRWSPLTIAKMTFGVLANEKLATDIFSNEIWLNLNRGIITEMEAKNLYQNQFGFSDHILHNLFENVKKSQILIDGTLDIVHALKRRGYGIYGLTDNVHEIIAHLKKTYDFWPLFDGVIVSAEENLLKPDPVIFERLTQRYQLKPEGCIFFDDVQKNVEGARSVGINAFVFTTSTKCKIDLKGLGVEI